METAKKLGCGAFEVFLSGTISCPPAVIKTAAEKFGLKVIGLPIITPDADPLSTDEKARARAIAILKAHIKTVRRMGGSLVAGPLANVLGRTDVIPDEKQYKACVKTFARVAKFADEQGVRVAIEPLQWSEIAWPNTCAQVVKLIHDVEEIMPRGVLGVLFDIYHALRMEENWLSSLRDLLKEGLLFHCHAAGPGRTPPRITQHINWRGMVSQLKEAGWEGTITIESFGKECDLPLSVVGPCRRLPAQEVIHEGVAALRQAGLDV
jgi:D-psicose/D-tagatose/L-ribulose 3-epimerase